jgi:hypothetical protein
MFSGKQWDGAMPERWSVRDAFGYFGAVPANIQWSWSARSPDGRTVAVVWWKDERAWRDGRLVYDMRNRPNLREWQGRPGNRERAKNLAYARDHCDGLFRIVWASASDPSARVRKTVERYPDKTLRMRLIELDEETGEFLAEEIGHA